MRLLPLVVGIALASFQSQRGFAAETVDHEWRVLGAVTATTDAGVVRLVARDHAHARMLLSKLLADFTTLPTVTVQDVAGATGPRVLVFAGGRRLLPMLRAGATTVAVHAFPDAAALTAFVATQGAELSDAVRIDTRQHPAYLDRWDRHAMGFWYDLGRGPKDRPDLNDEADFAFFREQGLSVNICNDTIAPAIARRSGLNGLSYKINRWFTVGNWVYDRFPEVATTGDPDLTDMYDYYGEVPFAENPIERDQVGEMMAYLKPYVADEHLDSITLPHGETGPEAASYSGYRDRDEYSRQDLIHYLRDLRGLSLTDLGQRWYGDAKRFARWEDVTFPRERDFYGWQEGESQSLAGTWRLRSATRVIGEQDQVFLPGHDDRSWMTFAVPGSQYLGRPRPGDRQGGWMRSTFTPGAEIQAAIVAGKPVYLTVCPFNNAPYKDPSLVYLNGEKLGEMTVGYGQEWGQFDVARLLKPGVANQITVYALNAQMKGPVFLTTRHAQAFPGPDAQLNARLHDVREWVADCCARANDRYLAYVRGIDPDRPVKLMAFDSMIDVMMPYVQVQGAYPHCTGEGAFFRPWFKRHGYLRGIPDSSEPGGPAKDLEGLRSYFFCMTMEGMNAHDYFIHLHNVTGDPAQKEWYVRNLPYFQLMGRFDLKKPEVAILRSPQADRFTLDGGGTIYLNDIARGDIQQTHTGYVFTTERDLRDRLVDGYKVIVDSNLHTVDEADVTVLEDWVRRGGTLVLNQRSGRNDYLHANSWPIARLTGCTATIRPQTGKVTFDAKPAILAPYAGKSFANHDNLFDWQKIHYFTDCIALTPTVPDVQVVARYDDGAAAVVTRPLGAGRVVVLGSAFYRDAHDASGYFEPSAEQTVFYRQLFADLGVKPLVDSPDRTLWAERFIANNGSTEMLILGNQSASVPLKGASARWDLGFVPKRVFDPGTGAELPVRIDGTTVVIEGLDVPPRELRYFAVERTDMSGSAAVGHWLGRQDQLWRAAPAGRVAPPVPTTWPLRVEGPFSAKQFASEAAARQALAAPAGDDWNRVIMGDLASQGLRTGDVWTVYRTTIEASPAWLRGLRGAEVVWSWPYRPEWFVDVRINGLVIARDTMADQGKILAALHPGSNEVTVIAGPRRDGIGGMNNLMAVRGIPGAGGEVIELNDGWTLQATETSAKAVVLPLKDAGLMLRRQITIPERMRGSTFWLEVTGEPRTTRCAAVNGRFRYAANAYGAQFNAAPLLVNVTPDIRFGVDNEIAVGGDWHGGFKVAGMDIRSARLVVVPPGAAAP